ALSRGYCLFRVEASIKSKVIHALVGANERFMRSVRLRMTMKKNIEVGVVGCGYWGPNLVRNLTQAQDCQLKVLCDSSEARLNHMRRLYPEVATTTRFNDLLEDPELDALVIATPVSFHYQMAKAALSLGKHVFIEKPIARTEAEAQELVAL